MLSGSAGRMLMKLTIGVKFINILCVNFTRKDSKSAKRIFWLTFLCFWDLSLKVACKMLVKSTLDLLRNHSNNMWYTVPGTGGGCKSFQFPFLVFLILIFVAFELKFILYKQNYWTVASSFHSSVKRIILK